MGNVLATCVALGVADYCLIAAVVWRRACSHVEVIGISSTIEEWLEVGYHRVGRQKRFAGFVRGGVQGPNWLFNLYKKYIKHE